ncbi:MAG: D-alanyl-D-alanine carboxypeptidase [Clostridia bacterium]|nr:D-alanyl-D-alanine carboxypeptidase [Clostridia bacterium]
MKRWVIFLFFCCFFLYNSSAALADAAAAAVIEEKTGRILYASNEMKELPMASTTKIMTAMLAIENCNLNEIVTAGENAFGVPGTSIYLEKGEQLSLGDMLYGLMLASGNDAAVAIAEHVGGSVSSFCEMMNARAARIGCIHTHYVTPHGLPAQDHYTTALELALIAREAMQYPFFRHLVSTQRATIPWQNHEYDRVLTNKNKLLSSFSGALGIKTGYTKAAGRCLAFAAERNGMTLIGAVLNSPDWFDHSATLLEQAFEEYHMYTALNAGEIVYRLPVRNGIRDGVDLITADALSAPLSDDETAEISFRWAQVQPAGFEKGDVLGSATLMVNGMPLDTVSLIAAEGVPERSFQYGVVRSTKNWLFLGN